MKKLAILILLITTSIHYVAGQHEEHQHQPAADTTKESHDHHTADAEGPPMSHSYSLNLPMNRNGSGTAWQPDRTPMYGYMWHGKRWMWMGHGNIVLRYNTQDFTSKGSRGDSKVDAPNWFMLMGQRRVGARGLLHVSSMLSLDAIFGGNGYPLLFQTGELYKGTPLIDRQHPHDLFSEISIGYTHAFSKDMDMFAYVGYPGEPALGPTAFMHRPSSANNPDAPLGHHWQDATHIVFGVATMGIRYKIVKLDWSLFTGREPDENRYNFDKPTFDSYSARVTINPAPSLSMQMSQAYIVSPESIHPDENVRRTTASATHTNKMAGENHFLSTTAAWGFNNSEDHDEHSFLLESNLQLDRFAAYGRFEYVQKPSGELGLTALDEDTLWNINAFTIGANFTILRKWKTNFSLGGQGSVSMAPADLNSTYGNNPLSAEIYLRISPTLMSIPR